MDRNKYIAYCLCLCIALSAAQAQSVEFANPRAVSMARASMVTSRGLDAVGLNPANLGLGDRSRLTVSLFPLGLRAGTNFFTWNTFEKYFSGVQTDSGKVGKLLSDADKQDILGAFPSGKGTVTGGGTLTLFAVSYYSNPTGGIAFTINERIGASATIPREYLQIILYGNPLGSHYDFSGTSASAQWVREYALSYGRRLPGFGPITAVSAGASLKLIQGFAYGEIDQFRASISTDQIGALGGTAYYHARSAAIDAISDTSNASISPFPAPAGAGFGLDLGVAGRIMNVIQAAVSMTDIGSMNWTRNAKEYTASANVTLTDPTSKEQRDSITNAFKAKESPISSFDSQLPTVLRIGVGVELQQLPVFATIPGTMKVEIDYIQGLNASVGNTKSPRFALGIDYHPISWIPIRTGLGFGGNERVHWGFGTGINFENFDLEVGTEDILAVIAPGSMSTASFAFGMRLRF